MMTEAQIATRVGELLLAELQRRLVLERLPHHCVHNHRQPLDHRRTVYGEVNGGYNRISAGTEDGVSLPVLQTMGLCMLGADSPETWNGTICEEPLDAQRCPYFEHRLTRAKIYEQFKTSVQDAAWVEANLPAVHALLWALGGSLKVSSSSAWGRVWAWVVRQFSVSLTENSADVLVYLPAFDALPDENGARAPSPN